MSLSILIHSLKETLQQGELLLTNLSSSQYTQTVPVAFNASIGGHYRHSLEHSAMVIDICGNPWTEIVLDYDKRARNVEIESNLKVALEKTRELIQLCDQVDVSALENRIILHSKTSYGVDALSAEVSSNLGREVMFIISHTIHHYALIGIMCGILDIPLPEGFGVAPSTVKYRSDVAKSS